MDAKIFITSPDGELVQKEIFPSVPLNGIITLEKDESKLNTDFLGFGVAATGSSCYCLSKLDSETRHEVLTDLFTPQGLNLSVCRLSVGASDYSAELYTYDDTENDTSLENFSIDRDRKYVLPMIKEILAIRPDVTFFASPWSPPAWMKTGNSVGGGFMREKYLDCYGDYIVKFIEAYEAEGIHIHALTPQNEPLTDQNATMPACLWSPELEAKFILILRRKFQEKNIKTEIWCHDHSFAGAHKVRWCFDEFPELEDACDGIAFHYYSGCIEETECLKQKYPSLKLHFTEGGPRLYDNYATDWCKWTLMVTKAFGCGYSSFTGWNLMLDEKGFPNVGPFTCGGLVTHNSTDGALVYSGQSKAFRHFACITPESKIYPLYTSLVSTAPIGPDMFAYPRTNAFPVTGCAIENPDGKTHLVLVNPTAKSVQIQYCLNGTYYYIPMPADSVGTVVFGE